MWKQGSELVSVSVPDRGHRRAGGFLLCSSGLCEHIIGWHTYCLWQRAAARWFLSQNCCVSRKFYVSIHCLGCLSGVLGSPASVLGDIIGDNKRMKLEGGPFQLGWGWRSLCPGRPVCPSEEGFLFCDAQGSREARKPSVGLCLLEAPLPCLLLSQGRTW